MISIINLSLLDAYDILKENDEEFTAQNISSIIYIRKKEDIILSNDVNNDNTSWIYNGNNNGNKWPSCSTLLCWHCTRAIL